MRKRAATFAVLVFVGGAACTGSEVAPADAGTVDADAASATTITAAAIHAATLAYRTKYCPLVATCDPVLFTQTYGTLANCVQTEDSGPEIVPAQSRGGFAQQGAAPWRGYGFGYGTLLTPDALNACSNAIDPTDCNAYVRIYYEHAPPAACQSLLYGALPDGSPCGAANQCKSGRCFGPSPPGFIPCGTCAPTNDVGAACLKDILCVQGTACRGPSAGEMICVPYGDVGTTCNANAPCHANLLCGAGGTCEAPPSGNACDPALGCSQVPMLRYCNPATSTCDALPFAASLGAPCGSTFVPTVLCAYEYTCTIQHASPNDAGVDAAASVCTNFLEEGAACNAADHPLDVGCKSGFCFIGSDKCDTSGAARCSAPPVAP